MTDLATLIEALEAATEPSRELDAHIFCAVIHPNQKPQRNFFYTNREEWGVFTSNQPLPGLTFHDAPRYSASLDAALTLIPEGWTAWELRSRANKSAFVADLACLKADDNEEWAIGHGPTPALALCIAALKARAA